MNHLDRLSIVKNEFQKTSVSEKIERAKQDDNENMQNNKILLKREVKEVEFKKKSTSLRIINLKGNLFS